MKSIKKYSKRLLGHNHIQSIAAIVVVLAVAVAGVHLLVSSRAQSPYVATQADSGNLTSPATVQTCTGSSNGKCVQFGSGYFAGKLLGVQNANNAENISYYSELHANSTRVDIELNSTNNAFLSTPGHELVNTDTTLDDITSAHLVVIPLMNTYTPITSGSTVYVDPTTWANAVVTWCKVYCYGGSFYINNPNANEYYAPRILEMLNEPYGPWYRSGAVPTQGYANMLTATRSALNNAGFSYIGILGAVGNAGDSTNAWTTSVAADGGYKATIGMAVHPYSSNTITTSGEATAQNGWDTLYYYHQLYGMDMYVTEVGFCTTNTVDTATCGDSGNIPEASKDNDIADAITQLATVSWIKNFDYFDLADFGECIVITKGSPCVTEYNSYGLLLSTGIQTPAFSTYQTAAQANGF